MTETSHPLEDSTAQARNEVRYELCPIAGVIKDFKTADEDGYIANIFEARAQDAKETLV